MKFRGTAGADRRVGGNDDDLFRGMAGDDALFGGAGSDRLFGGDGNDTLGSAGEFYLSPYASLVDDRDATPDLLDGGAGNDFIAGGWNDTLLGGAGIDIFRLDLTGADRGVDLDLDRMLGGRSLRIGDGRIAGFERFEELTGTAFADTIRLGAIGTASRISWLPALVDGGGGDDRIEAGSSAVYVFGGDGNDLIIGSADDDVLEGGSGNDRIVTRGGDDSVDGGDGNDVIDVRGMLTTTAYPNNAYIEGGNGRDTVIMPGKFADYSVSSDATQTYRLVYGEAAPATDLLGIETVRFDDVTLSIADILPKTFYGTGSDDILGPGTGNIGAGADIIYGMAGDDTIDGGRGGDAMYGGAGADTFIIDNTGDTTDATREDRIISRIDYVAPASWSYNGAALVSLAGDGDLNIDDIWSAAILGNAGANRLRGNGLIEGGLGDDTIVGYVATYPGSGDETSIASYAGAAGAVSVDLTISGPQDTGSAGRDTLIDVRGLRGSDFNDRLYGGTAPVERFEGGAGDDLIDGRGGVDFAMYRDATGGVVLDLSIGGAQDTRGAGIDTLIGIEGVIGSDYADRLFGDRGANSLYGGAGDDVLSGGGGDDYLDGGDGKDVYLFRVRSDLSSTIVLDLLQGDRIDLSAIDADSTLAGDQAFRLVNAFTGAAGELRLISDGYSTVALAGDIDGDGRADFRITVWTNDILTGEGWAL